MTNPSESGLRPLEVNEAGASTGGLRFPARRSWPRSSFTEGASREAIGGVGGDSLSMSMVNALRWSEWNGYYNQLLRLVVDHPDIQTKTRIWRWRKRRFHDVKTYRTNLSEHTRSLSAQCFKVCLFEFHRLDDRPSPAHGVSIGEVGPMNQGWNESKSLERYRGGA